MKIKWFYIALVDFGDAECAPTPWTSIKDVNVHDPRIQRYKKDKNRKGIAVQIDRLWNNSGGKEGKQ
jgi:hypothetical protein